MQYFSQKTTAALFGSWNRSTLAGYKVVFVPFKNDSLTGFIANTDKSEVHGIAVTKDSAPR